ncbi:MAG: OmpH family outer membrane protein [Pseudomonadota bacterium]
MANIKKYLLAFVVCLSALLFNTSFAYAEKSHIAIVDMEKILAESLAGKSLEKQLKEKREAFQQEFTQRENQLLETEKTLIQEKSNLTADAFEEKRKQFELGLLETRNLFQKRRNALDKGLDKALAELRENVMQITADISERQGFSIVLTRDSVVIADKELDITNQILDKMNSSMKTIPLVVAQ